MLRTFILVFRVLIFLALLAFAMNNLQPATVNWFFSATWSAPLVIIVLIAFGCGAVFGVLAMTPSWWRHRRAARRRETLSPEPVTVSTTLPPAPDATQVRDGL
ncbi:MAG TPA: LapA family protein [Burkholderiaceae bacterium]|nr:LapA family protein [Burkholderiaceae bacterium]